MRANLCLAGLFPRRFFVAAALVLGLSAVAWAQMRGPHGRGGPMGELRMFLRVADLTADQKAKVHELRRASRQHARPLVEQLRALREQIADKLAGPGAVAPSDLASLQQQAASIVEQLGQQRVQVALQIRALLTPEQLAKVSDTYQKMKALKAEMRSLVTPPAESPAEGAGATPDESPAEEND